MFSELYSELFLRSFLKTVVETAGAKVTMAYATTSQKAFESRTVKHLGNRYWTFRRSSGDVFVLEIACDVRNFERFLNAPGHTFQHHLEKQ